MEIIRPAEKIEVIESKKQCTAGSVGYLVYQQPYDMYNICKAVIVFIRLGNKGRNRIEPMNINTVLIDIDSIAGLTTKNKEVLKERAMANAIMPRYPDKCHIINGSIKKTQMPSKNIIYLDIWDFLGYICSLSLFMRRIKNGGEAQLALTKYHPSFLKKISETHISDIPPTSMADYIYAALNSSKLGADKERSKMNLSLYLNYFENTKNRAACMDKMHRVFSTLREGVLNYSGYMIRSRQEMINRIKATISNKKISNKKTPEKIRYRAESMESPVPSDRPHVRSRANRIRLRHSDIRLEPQENPCAEQVGCGLSRPFERSIGCSIEVGRYEGNVINTDEVREAYRHITGEEEDSLRTRIEPMEVNPDTVEATIVDDVENDERCTQT